MSTISNVVSEICRVCVLTFKLTNTHTVSPAMVLYAVEVLFKTKMDEAVDETYEQENKKEINKITREMGKYLETMRGEEQKKFRIGGNAPTLVFRAKKQFGQDEPVEEKKTAKTKKTKAAKKDADAEPVAVEEPNANTNTPVLQDESVAAAPELEPVVEPVLEKPKTKKTKPAKKDQHEPVVIPEPAVEQPAQEEKPNKTAAKKTKAAAEAQSEPQPQPAQHDKQEEKPKPKPKPKKIAKKATAATAQMS